MKKARRRVTWKEIYESACAPDKQAAAKPTPKLIDEKFADINGRKYRRYTVRTIGGSFAPFDKWTNTFVIANADLYRMTRAEAWEYLRSH